MRESKRAEEDDWLVRNRKHLYKNPKAKDITEQDPHWLKDKADGFYRSRDYRGAVNAYTAAIQADSEFVPAYSNRAACYLRLRDYLSCQNDCTTALKLLRNQENKDRLRIKLLVRRGSARTHYSSVMYHSLTHVKINLTSIKHDNRYGKR